MGRAAMVTFALNVSGVPSAAVAQDAIDDFQANFVTNFGVLLDAEVLIEQPSIRLGDGSTVPYEAVGAAAAVQGTDAITSAPPQVALLVKKLTGLGGRANHGRTYFPFVLPTADVSENGTIDPTFLATWQSNVNNFLAQLVTDTTPLCLAHKVFNVPLPPHFVTAVHTGPLVSACICESMVATQRRRIGR
jgi:hypothetical protein